MTHKTCREDLLMEIDAAAAQCDSASHSNMLSAFDTMRCFISIGERLQESNDWQEWMHARAEMQL